MLLLVLTAALCAGCTDQTPTAASRRPAASADATTRTSESGCVRLWTHRNPTSTSAIVDRLTSTAACSGWVGIQLDGSPTFDSSTAALRIPVKLKNLTDAPQLVPPVRVTYLADSTLKYDHEVLSPGTADLRGYGDSTSADHRVSVWRFDTLLAPSGQPQVLPANGTSQRVWLEFRSSDWSYQYSLRLDAIAAVGAAVPAVAPDSIPRALMDSLGTIPTFYGDTVWRDMLEVVFAPSATQTQRQSAISSVSGVVVGGVRWFQGDGSYYVRIPASGSYDQLLRASEALKSYSFVELAGPIFRGPLKDDAYLKPSDGAGWTRGDWAVSKALASGPNWALEAINAPSAWGCETGNASVKVSIVDRLFSTGTAVPDVDSNVTAFLGLPVGVTTVFHGQRIASIIAARGNNGTGMTGVMWRASLEERSLAELPSNYSAPDNSTGSSRYTNLARHLINAGLAGARIINFSQAAKWALIAPGRTPDTTRLDSLGRADRRELSMREDAVRIAIARLASQGIHPLFVLAAGNEALDATFAGFTRVKATFPDQVIVVGGIRPDRTGWPPSNTGRLVDVLAPAEAVAVTDVDGTIVLDQGTSFAAPLVAGAAGLLASFDGASMTAARMKQLLVTAATDSATDLSGRRIPIVDAYAALKEAAKRPGAPLCGNRVWVTPAGNLTVDRGPATAPTTEALASGAEPGSFPITFHGGRRLSTIGRNTAWDWTYSAPGASWTQTPFAGALPNDGSLAGSYLSTRSESHYADTTISANIRPNGNGVWDLTLFDATVQQQRIVASVNPGALFARVAVAYSPVQPRLLVASSSAVAAVGKLQWLDLRTGAFTPVALDVTNRFIADVGINEDETEFVMAYSDLGSTTCKIEWRSARVADFGTLLASVTSVDSQISSFCDYRFLGGSAPSIANDPLRGESRPSRSPKPSRFRH